MLDLGLISVLLVAPSGALWGVIGVAKLLGRSVPMAGMLERASDLTYALFLLLMPCFAFAVGAWQWQVARSPGGLAGSLLAGLVLLLAVGSAFLPNQRNR